MHGAHAAFVNGNDITESRSVFSINVNVPATDNVVKIFSGSAKTGRITSYLKQRIKSSLVVIGADDASPDIKFLSLNNTLDSFIILIERCCRSDLQLLYEHFSKSPRRGRR